MTPHTSTSARGSQPTRGQAIELLTASDLKERGLSHDEISSKLRSMSAPFQRLMTSCCHPDRWLVPVEHKDRGGIRFIEHSEVDKLTPATLLPALDPRRLNEELLKKLGATVRKERGEIVLTEEIASALLTLFRESDPKPLGAKNRRIFVVGAAMGHLAGSLLCCRAVPDAKRGETILSHYDDLASALRSKGHQRRSHGEELVDLTSIVAMARDISTRLRDEPKPDKSEMFALEEASRLLATSVLALGAPLLREKARAQKKLSGAAGLRDSIGRRNPNGIAKKLEAGVERLEERQDDIAGMEGVALTEEVRLRTVHERDSQLFFKAAKTCAYTFGTARKLAEQDPKSREVSARGWLNRVGIGPQTLESLQIRPWRTFAKHLERMSERFVAEVREGERDATLGTLREIRAILDLTQLQSLLHEAQGALVRGLDGVSYCHGTLELIGHLTKVQLAERSQLSPALEGLDEAIEVATRRASSPPKNTDSFKAKNRYLNDLKANLDAIDFEARLHRASTSARGGGLI